MPWVILAAALCVLVWFWPRNTLIAGRRQDGRGAAGMPSGDTAFTMSASGTVTITVEPAAEAAADVARHRGEGNCSSPSRTGAGRR
ncbi:MAG: hypothetical protein ACLSTO_09380 [Bilophila wadsworthia]